MSMCVNMSVRKYVYGFECVNVCLSVCMCGQACDCEYVCECVKVYKCVYVCGNVGVSE